MRYEQHSLLDRFRHVFRGDAPEHGPRMKVYLGGPMRGYDLYNYQAFEDVTVWLRREGFEVFTPHEFDIELGYVDCAYAWDGDRRIFTKVELRPEFDMHKVMKHDIRTITEMDAVVFLPGWQQSRGSRMEDTVREFCGIPRWIVTPLVNGGYVLEQTTVKAAA